MEIDKAFVEICKEFNKNNVRYVVIGGFAMIMHGLPRTTVDIDFFIENSPDNIKRIKQSLKAVFNDETVNEITTEDIEKYPVIRYGTQDGFYIDFISNLGTVASYSHVANSIDIFEIDKVEIPVCNVDLMIKLKQTVRHRDLADLEFLRNKKNT
jgi:hypothetical protein